MFACLMTCPHLSRLGAQEGGKFIRRGADHHDIALFELCRLCEGCNRIGVNCPDVWGGLLDKLAEKTVLDAFAEENRGHRSGFVS